MTLFAKRMKLLISAALFLVWGFCSAADSLVESRVVGYRPKVFKPGDGITFICKLVRSEDKVCFVQGHQRHYDSGNAMPLIGYPDEISESEIDPVQLDDYRVFVTDLEKPAKVDWSRGDRGQLYKSDVFFMVPKALGLGQIREGSQDLYVAVSLPREEFDAQTKLGDGHQHACTVYLEIPTYRLSPQGTGFIKTGSIPLIIPKLQIDQNGALRFVGKDPAPDDLFVYRGEANPRLEPAAPGGRGSP